jgi:hypothetical protein
MPRLEPLKSGHGRIVMNGELVQVPLDSDVWRDAHGLPRAVPTPVPASPSMSFGEALFYKQHYGSDAVLPPDMEAFSMLELKQHADAEQRPAREKREAEEAARRIEATRHSIERALLSGPPRRRTPSRLRACFLRQLERWGSISQAAAAVGLDRRTIHRWRERDAAFAARCETALQRRAELLEDEGYVRARQPRVRPFFYGGRKVGEVTTYNDNLLVKMLHETNLRRDRNRPPAIDAGALGRAVAHALTPVLRTEMSRIAGQPESQSAAD